MFVSDLKFDWGYENIFVATKKLIIKDLLYVKIVGLKLPRLLNDVTYVPELLYAKKSENALGNAPWSSG